MFYKMFMVRPLTSNPNISHNSTSRGMVECQLLMERMQVDLAGDDDSDLCLIIGSPFMCVSLCF